MYLYSRIWQVRITLVNEDSDNLCMRMGLQRMASRIRHDLRTRTKKSIPPVISFWVLVQSCFKSWLKFKSRLMPSPHIPLIQLPFSKLPYAYSDVTLIASVSPIA